MTSLVALSIDAMLPALITIGAELGAREANDAQLILSALFLGLALAQMIYGPLSDSIGRKPAIYPGFLLFIVGCLLSALTTSFTVMLLGRFLQGIGAAGPRIVTIAMVRDQYEGRAMARIMSSVMAVFILIPALAPESDHPAGRELARDLRHVPRGGRASPSAGSRCGSRRRW